MKNSIIKILIICILLSIPLFTYAVNDVTLNGNTSFELDTTDSAASKTITGLNGGNVTQLDIETAYMDVTLDNASDITFSNDASFYFNTAVQSGTGSTITPSCPTSLVRLESTGNTVIRITLTDAAPSCSITTPSTPTYVCGNGTCETGENTTSCPADCNTGGGGGGGGGGAGVSSTSNTTTSKVTSKITTITGNQKFSRPIEFKSSAITVDESAGTKTATATGDGTLTIKPNSKSTIFLEIPKNTDVEGSDKWDGKIDPPLIKSNNLVNKTDGDDIEGSTDKLQYRDIDTIIEVGSDKTPLKFTNKVKLEVPVKSADGSTLNIYSSEDGKIWTLEGSGTVKDGKIVYETGHLTYYVFEKTGELHGAAPAAVVQKTMAFTDISGHWAKSYIEDIADKGIVSGKTSTTFAPNDNITRAELTKIAVEALFTDSEIDNCLTNNTQPSWSYIFFKDVMSDAWFAKYICVAKMNSVVQGMNGEFKPNMSITRAAALKILLEAAGFADIESNFSSNYSSNVGWSYAAFKDVMMGEWFAKYVAYAKDNSIVGGYGDGEFKAGNSITRAEVAKIVMKVLDLVE